MEKLGDDRKYGFRIFCFTIGLIVLFVISFLIGRYPIHPLELIGMLGDSLLGVLNKFLSLFGANTDFHIEQFWDENTEAIFFAIRLPRILLACLVGCCISMAGAAYQGVFQNPMAAPDILGASSGAAFGAALAIILGGTTFFITGSAFAFSLITVLFVMLVSKFASGSKILGLILGGIVISSLFTSGTSYLKLVADPNDQLPQITYWLMGSLTEAKLSEVGFACIPMLLGIIPLILLRWRINILTLGDEEAASMGVDTKRVRLFVIICSTLITAASVSVSGMIGWVGLVIPHFARRIVGNNYMHLMILSMVLGALFLLGVDDISRILIAKEIPLGILTSLIGAPFFIYLLTRKEELT
ncbi:MAG: iron ABC transporter permease [Bacillota bacterium]|nr:iron ABC transporter permease [Bacillota bacterium]